jgi:hypothetical protein
MLRTAGSVAAIFCLGLGLLSGCSQHGNRTLGLTGRGHKLAVSFDFDNAIESQEASIAIANRGSAAVSVSYALISYSALDERNQSKPALTAVVRTDGQPVSQSDLSGAVRQLHPRDVCLNKFIVDSGVLSLDPGATSAPIAASLYSLFDHGMYGDNVDTIVASNKAVLKHITAYAVMAG